MNGRDWCNETDGRKLLQSGANEQFFSVSQYKGFMKCEAMALAKIRGQYRQPSTRALLVGSFVDSYFEGSWNIFMEENPELFTRRNELRSEFRKPTRSLAEYRLTHCLCSL